MLLKVFVFLVFICVLADASNEKCEDKNCLAYPCFEKTAHCDYLISFGEKYCFRFKNKETMNMFDEAGQKFLNCTAPCLIHSMQKYMDQTAGKPVDCDKLTSNAFNSHAGCYLECNFCNVCKTNKLALLKSYDITDFFGRDAIAQVWKVISECGVFNCF